MWASLAAGASRFLASRSLSLVLIAAVAGAGWWIYTDIKQAGADEQALKQALEANSQWQARLDRIQAEQAESRKLLSQINDRLQMQQQRNRERADRLKASLSELGQQSATVRKYLSQRMPRALVERLCNAGQFSGAASQELCGTHPPDR